MRLPLIAVVFLGAAGPALAQTSESPALAQTTQTPALAPTPQSPESAQNSQSLAVPQTSQSLILPQTSQSPIFTQAPQRLALADQTSQDTVTAPQVYPRVTFGVVTFLQFAAELHEQEGYNAFDVTRGYFNVRAQLNDRISVRFTPDVRPTTDASLDRNLALRLEYASLDVQATDTVKFMFGLHETPWLTFEESLNRYRVLGPLFAERLELIPGATDLGASIKWSGEHTEAHLGVYNGEGYGRAEVDKYKSIDGRATFRPFSEDSELGKVSISGFYQYGWYARDRPRNVAIVMGSYENTNFVGTAQYLSATDNPFVAVDVKRRGLSFFGEGRQGETGWAGVGGLDIFVPDVDNEGDQRRRMTFGGAHWSELGRGRLGVVISMQQEYRSAGSQLLERRLLAQTHIEF